MKQLVVFYRSQRVRRYYNPRLQQLRERYDLDAVVAGEAGEWTDCDEQITVALADNRDQKCVFRTVNLFGVTGAEHTVELTTASA